MKLKHTGGNWIVRKTVDNSGDYPFPCYDILALHDYGPEGIAEAYQNPYNAKLIACAPDFIEDKIKDYKEIGRWLSAALSDPNVCTEMKSDIEKWFNRFKTLTDATGIKLEDLHDNIQSN